MSSRRRTPNILGTAVIPLILLALVSGCQGEDDSTATGDSPPSVSASESAAAVAMIEKLVAQRKGLGSPTRAPSSPLMGHKDYIVNDDGIVTQVDLSNTPLVDDDLALLLELSSIEVLMLSGTKITDSGLAHLKGLPKLRTLTLYVTAVSDDGIPHLTEIKGLTRLGINTTHVTEDGMETLRRALPDCKVH